MPVTARLSEAFYQRLGEDIAAELVTWFNDVDATYRADLREVNELNFARFDAKLEQRLSELRSEMHGRFAALDVKIAVLEVTMGARFGVQDALIDKRLAQQDALLEKRLAQQDALIDKRLTQQDALIEQRFAEQDARLGRRLTELETRLTVRMYVLFGGSLVAQGALMITLFKLFR